MKKKEQKSKKTSSKKNLALAPSSFWQNSWLKRSLWVVLALFLLYFMLRSCSGLPMAEKKEFKVARDTTWYPFNLEGKEKNMVGFTDELMSLIDRETNADILIFDIASKSLFIGLDNQKWDGVLSSLEPTTVNKQKYLFSTPFFVTGNVIVVHQDSKIQKISDLNNKIVGIFNDVELEHGQSLPSAIFTPYAKASEALRDLASKNLDAVIMDFNSAYDYIQSLYQNKLKIATTAYVKASLRLITLNDADGKILIKKFDEGFSELQQNGMLHHLLDKWKLLTP